MRGAFITLEKYGVQMKGQMGSSFKRSIKFDDQTMSLRIDVLFPGDERWTVIPVELAGEEVNRITRQEIATARQRINSLSGGATAIEQSRDVPTPPIIMASSLPTSAQLIKHGQPGPSSRWSGTD